MLPFQELILWQVYILFALSAQSTLITKTTKELGFTKKWIVFDKALATSRQM
jgi:hypothetical protein